MKVFVTGGNGFIGSRVVRTLLDRGHSVRCLVRPGSDTRKLDGLEIERIPGDIRERASLVPGMKGVDGCIHLASVSTWAGMRTKGLPEATMLEGTRNVMEAAEDVRVVHVSSAAAINASSGPVVFDEESPFELGETSLHYAIMKHRSEGVALESGGDVVIVNPAEVYGPDDDNFITAGNIRDILGGWPAIGCTGGTAIVHVDDVATGIVLALGKGRSGERYILGGDNLTVEEVIRMVLDIAGQKKPVWILPNRLLLWTVKSLAFLRLPTPLSPDMLELATRFFFVDSGKARSELGFDPRPAREVLEPVVRWLMGK